MDFKGCRFGGFAQWYHLECFADEREHLEFWTSGKNLLGFRTLRAADQLEVELALPAIKPSVYLTPHQCMSERTKHKYI